MISVIVPTYNAEAYIAATLTSVIQQDFANWELLVVDDGSRDSTVQIIRDFASRDARITIYTKENGGESAARNFGLARSDASRPYVIFLDHDDTWEPNALRTLLQAAEADPKCAGAHALAREMNKDGEIKQTPGFVDWMRNRRRLVNGEPVLADPSEPTDFSILAFQVTIVTMGVCLLRRAAIPADPFPNQMRAGSADWLLYLQLTRTSHFQFVDEIILNKRLHANNTTNDSNAVRQSIVVAMATLCRQPETSPEQKRIIQASHFRRHSNSMYFELKMLKKSIFKMQPKAIMRRARRALVQWRVRNLVRAARRANIPMQ